LFPHLVVGSASDPSLEFINFDLFAAFSVVLVSHIVFNGDHYSTIGYFILQNIHSHMGSYVSTTSITVFSILWTVQETRIIVLGGINRNTFMVFAGGGAGRNSDMEIQAKSWLK
jgi:hypothetical protein